MKIVKIVIGILMLFWTSAIAYKALIDIVSPTANTMGIQFAIYIGLALIISGNTFLIGIYFLIKHFSLKSYK